MLFTRFRTLWRSGRRTGLLLVAAAALLLVGTVPASALESAAVAPAGVNPAAGPTAVSGQPPTTKQAAVGTARRGGVTISPAFQQIALRGADNQGETFDFSVTNNANQAYEFALSVVDFGSLDETGGVLFVGSAEKRLNQRYALSKWVTLEKDRVTVEPHATEKVSITIVNKESMTPGGHYGAVLVSPTETGTASKVQIDQVATSLLFVKKQGGEVYRMNLSDMQIRPHVFRLPSDTTLRFQNAGNVHTVPRGLLTLQDPRGRIVKRGIINGDSGILLPESFRQFKTSLDTIGSSLLPGRYTLSADFRYEGEPGTRHSQTSFLYFNVAGLIGLFLVLLPILALVISRQLRRGLLAGIRRLVGRVRRGGRRLLRRPR